MGLSPPTEPSTSEEGLPQSKESHDQASLPPTDPSTGALLPWTSLIAEPTREGTTLFRGGNDFYVVDGKEAVVEAFARPD